MIVEDGADYDYGMFCEPESWQNRKIEQLEINRRKGRVIEWC